MRQKIDIPSLTILKIILILLALGFLYLVRDILLLLAVAIVIAAAINPIVDWLKKHGLPRLLGVIIVYLLILGILGFIITLVFPSLAFQIKQLGINLPIYLEKIGLEDWWPRLNLEGIGEQIGQAASSVLATTINIFGGLFSAIVILIISIYLVAQEEGIRKFITSITPRKHQAYVLDLVARIQKKMGRWLRGQLVLALIVGLLTFIGLSILQMPYALVLALIAGVLELLPYIGPILSAIPAIIIGFLQSPLSGLLVFILYVLIQQLENHLIVPQVMKRVLGLNPVVTIIAVLMGFKLAGILGAILAIPVAAAIAVFARDFMQVRMKARKKL